MKKLQQWINTRRDRRLRMWCVEQASTKAIGLSIASSAQEIYDWVKVECPRSNSFSGLKHFVLTDKYAELLGLKKLKIK